MLLFQAGCSFPMENQQVEKFQKGFSYAAWDREIFSSEKSNLSLENLREVGTDWISIVVAWYQNDTHSTYIHPDDELTPSDKSLLIAINKSHELGMKVMLKPHVDLYSGRWRGEIYFNREVEGVV